MLLALTLACLQFLSYSNAQNITVEDNSTDISYSSQQFGAANVCQVTQNGQVIGGQAGCYNVANQCTDSLHATPNIGDSVSFTFAGTAIYFNGLSDIWSGLLNVSVDGETTQVDGFSNNGPFVCRTMFSKTGLAPGVNHTINITMIGVSPQTSGGPSGLGPYFLVDQFIYTAGNSASNSSTGAGSGALKSYVELFMSLTGVFLGLFVIL